MQGLHLTADLSQCQCEHHWLVDASRLGSACEHAVAQAGLTVVGRLFHTFDTTVHGPGGVTATLLLAESHLCVHTWPETGSVTLDVYVCNYGGDHSHKARELLAQLLHLFHPTHTLQHEIWRGQQPTSPHTVDLPAGHTIAPPMTTPAIILAAGRGERMRPLTDTTPKPLLRVQGQALLAWHVNALVAGGFTQLVFNTAWLSHEISSFFDASRNTDGTFKLSFKKSQCLDCSPPDLPTPTCSHAFSAQFSNEQTDFGGALETAGGIARALPLLGAHHPPQPQDVFWVVAGDVFVPGFAFTQASVERFRASTHLAHLWLVPNPPHNPLGDFGLSDDGLALNLPKPSPPLSGDPVPASAPRYTYSTIGLYRAELFSPLWCDIAHGNPSGVKAPLAPLLRRAMDAGRVSAELYTGPWTDVGTPERLAELNAT